MVHIRARQCTQPRLRRGVMLPLVCVFLPVLALFLGFSVDLAYMQLTRTEVRAATDVAARSAASVLGETGDRNRAAEEAVRIAAKNKVGGRPLALDTSAIEFGVSRQGRSGRWVFTPGGDRPNAARVSSGDNHAVPLFFGKLIGLSDFTPTATATASFRSIDICLVLDRSTSMKVDVDSTESGLYTSDPRFCRPPGPASRWAALDNAVKVFTSTLRSANGRKQIAMASYSSAIVPARWCGTSTEASSLDLALTSDLGAVDSAIDTLSDSVWNGNTAIASGIQTGLEQLVGGSGSASEVERYLIVMTDGNQNVGDAESAADAAWREGVTVHTVTFSVDANQDLMRSVAGRAGGRHLHANTADELREAFRELAAQTARLTD